MSNEIEEFSSKDATTEDITYDEVVVQENINDPGDDAVTMMIDDTSRTVVIGSSSVIGKRKSQQDTIRTDNDYDYLLNGRCISILCDGMGGLSGGERASGLCSQILQDAFHQIDGDALIPEFYKSIIPLADYEVSALADENGKALRAGTTLTSVVIDDNLLYWASVGDSHIYIIRDNNIIPVTTDHNYSMILNERVQSGQISQETADSDPQKDALISYIGIGGVPYMDINTQPVQLADKDCVILCSDGLYRSLSNEEIMSVVCDGTYEAQLAAQRLTDLALSKGYQYQDNTSVVVIKFKDSG